MNKLKNKILFLSVSILLLSVVTIMTIATNNFIKEKQDTVTEMSSILLPGLAASLEKNLYQLRDEVSQAVRVVWNDRETEESTEKLNSIKGLVYLRVFQDRKEILTISKSDSFTAPADESDFPENNQMLLGRSHLEKIYKLIFNENARQYVVYFSSERLAPLLSTNRAFKFYLFDCSAVVSISGEDLAHHSQKICSDEALNQQVSVTQIDSGRLLAVSGFFAFKNIRLVGVIPLEEARELALALFRKLWIYALVLLVFAVVASYKLSKKIAEPVETLAEATTKISKGNWKLDLPVEGAAEIANLVTSFNKMGLELEMREQKLQQTHRELLNSEKLATLGKFSAGMAHEMKNPLNSIMNFSELLLRNKTIAESAKVTESVNFILSEAKRVNRIISDLMSFSRQSRFTKTEFDINEMLKHAFELQKPEALKAGIELQLQQAPQTLMYSGDNEKLLQVILNLVTNAFHAVEKSEIKKVILKSAVESGKNIISVADTGVGIEQEQMARIFEPFYTTKDYGKGTGLGLAICYGIVKEHEGEIKVESTIGKGTTMIVVLPEAVSKTS